MKHEPECPANWGVGEMPEPCAICPTIRTAYQRGRKDAAKAVREQCRGIPLTTASHASFMYLTAIAAARGDGEQV